MKLMALLAGKAVADAEFESRVLKGASRRLRPARMHAGGSYSDSWFQTKGSVWRGK